MTRCACSAAGPCIVHDGAWARLQHDARELGRNDFVSHNPAPTLRIDGRDVPVDLVLEVTIGLRDAGLLPRWSPDDGPVFGGATWEPCDTVHPGPAGCERVAGIFRLSAERSRLLGLLTARGAAR